MRTFRAMNHVTLALQSNVSGTVRATTIKADIGTPTQLIAHGHVSVQMRNFPPRLMLL
jgi:hypothetical protein